MKCQSEAEKSFVKELFSGSATLGIPESFYDEDGRYHYHGSTVFVVVYKCSNGHETRAVNHTACTTVGCTYKTGDSKVDAVEYFLADIGIQQ